MAFLLVKQSSAIYNILLTLLIIYLSISITEEARIRLHENGTFPALIAFGDSILDTGNNNNLPLATTKCNFAPYGTNFIGGKPTGRFCDGKLLTDIIAEGLGIKDIVPAYLDPTSQSKDLPTGVCFASSGSGLDPLTAATLQVITLQGQLDNFKAYMGKLRQVVGEEKANNIISNTVVLLSSGNNDIGITYFNNPIRLLHYSVDSYTSKLVKWSSNFIKDLHGLGLRKIAVLSVLPVGCIPGVRTLRGGPLRHCAHRHNEASLTFNSKLSTEVENLNSSLQQANIVYVDVFNPLLDLIKNPERKGFTVGDRGCCGTGKIEFGPTCNQLTPLTCSNASKFVFWDSAHPSERAYRIIGSPIVQDLKTKFS